jgi:hypothetical protein
LLSSPNQLLVAYALQTLELMGSPALADLPDELLERRQQVTLQSGSFRNSMDLGGLARQIRRRARERGRTTRSAAGGRELQQRGAAFEGLARGLRSGLLTVPEVASAVLNDLAAAPDPARLWASAPAVIRGPVLAYLAEVGANNVPPALWIGPGERDPARREAHAARRRSVAAELLAAPEPGVAPAPLEPPAGVAAEPQRTPDRGDGK